MPVLSGSGFITSLPCDQYTTLNYAESYGEYKYCKMAYLWENVNIIMQSTFRNN